MNAKREQRQKEIEREKLLYGWHWHIIDVRLIFSGCLNISVIECFEYWGNEPFLFSQTWAHFCGTLGVSSQCIKWRTHEIFLLFSRQLIDLLNLVLALYIDMVTIVELILLITDVYPNDEIGCWDKQRVFSSWYMLTDLRLQGRIFESNYWPTDLWMHIFGCFWSLRWVLRCFAKWLLIWVFGTRNEWFMYACIEGYDESNVPQCRTFMMDRL